MNLEGGYSPKQLKFGDEGREKLINGITTIANAVKSTLGPRGNTVLIESPNHTHGITVTKDGVTVAKAVDLIDPVENLAVKMMKEAADRTATLAGDGTTTAIVLTEALVKAGSELLSDPSINRTEVLKHLVNETNKVIDFLSENSTPVSDKTLNDVAIISANNDKAIGDIIAKVYGEVGKDGIVTLERSQNAETYYETTKGIKVDRGYQSPLFINNQKKDECILEDTYILVCDSEINNILSLENILRPIIAENKKLLIIAPCSTNVINTLAANVLKNGLKICAVPPPSFGYKQHELMQDIAIAVGANYFSEKTGDDLSLISFSDLGHAQKVIVDRDKTVIIKDDDDVDTNLIDERVAQLWDAHEIANKKADKDFIKSRIASLSGGIGVIYVGGNTDLEQKELYDRVDDAICAVRSALLEGILPGAGAALKYMSFIYDNVFEQSDFETKELKVAAQILHKSLIAPCKQILENGGLKIEDVYTDGIITFGQGYDLKNHKFGDLIEMGVIDPMKVTKSALQNAVSVAVTILSTNAIITLARSYDSE
jgi:chaperonin GroEL